MEAALFDRKGDRKYVNAAERKAYFQVVKNEPDPLRRAFCLTLFYTGCRISEGLYVTAGRIDLSERAIIFETLKQRKKECYRSVPIPDDLWKLLGRLLNKLEPSARVWKFSRSTGYRLVKSKMALAGIGGTKACPKGLRHGFGAACVGKTVPLTTIKKWFGHARIETTAIYLEVVGDEERALAKRTWSMKLKN